MRSEPKHKKEHLLQTNHFLPSQKFSTTLKSKALDDEHKHLLPGCCTLCQYTLLQLITKWHNWISQRLQPSTKTEAYRHHEVGWDLQRWVKSNLPGSKQGHPNQVVQDPISVRFLVSPKRPHKLSEQLFQCPATLTVCFLMLRISCFNLCPLPLVQSLCTTEKSMELPSCVYKHRSDPIWGIFSTG